MAVYPDRIVLKSSEESGANITAAIAPGGAEEILRGEIVLGISAGSARLYTLDNQGNVIQFGGSNATFLGSLEDVDLGGLVDGQVIKWNATEGLWKPANYTLSEFDEVSYYTFGARNPWPSTSRTLLDFTSTSSGFRIGTNGHILAESSGDVAFGVLGTSGQVLGIKVGRSSGDSVDIYAASGVTEFRGSFDDSQISLYNQAGSNYTGLRPSPSLASDIVWTLPNEVGEAGRVLTSDGTGAWYWSVGPAPDLSSSTLGSIGDVDLTGLDNGDYIRWNAATSTWTPTGGFSGDLNGLSDVQVTGDIVYVDHRGLQIEDLDSLPGQRVLLRTSSFAALSNYVTGNTTDLSIGSNASYNGGQGAITPSGEAFTVGNTSGGILRIGKTNSSTWLSNPNITNSVTLSTDSNTQSYGLKFPLAAGGVGQVLGTDGSGNLGWYDTFPPVGNGLIEYDIDTTVNPATFTGGGTGSPTHLVLFPGLSYRFTETGNSGISVTYSNGSAYLDGGMSGVGIAGGTMAWTVQPDTPPEGLYIGRSTTGLASNRIPLVIHSDVTPLGRNSVGDLSDVDVTSTPPGFNQALAWNGSNWAPTPVYNEVGSIFLQGAIWNTRVLTEAEANSNGYFVADTTGGVHTLTLFQVPSSNVSAASIFDSIIAEGDAVWINVTFFYSGGITNATGLKATTSFSQTGSDTYTITYDANSVSSSFTSIAVSLFERRLLEIPVDSVNGKTGDVILDIADINDVYAESITDLEVGFPYIKKTSGLVGGVELQSSVDGSSTVTYNLNFNNIDAAGVNRRELALKQNNAYIRKAEADTWVPLQASPQSDATGAFRYEDISDEAIALVQQSALNQTFFVKFELNPQEGYTLTADAILQYDFKDSLWKPSSPQISAGVSSVNGQTGDVRLALGDLIDVESTPPQTGEGLVWNGLTWGPGEVNTAVEWEITAITNSGTPSYLFTGDGFDAPTTQPTLYVSRGQSYVFSKSISAHPFQLQTESGVGKAAYTDGVTGAQPLGVGSMSWVVPMDAPGILYYQCTVHASMSGQIIVHGGGSLSELSLDDLTDVNYSGGSLDIDSLDEILFTSTDTPVGITRKIFSNSLYGVAMGSYGTGYQASYVYAHEDKGIEFRTGSNLIRLTGFGTSTNNQPELRWESGNPTGTNSTGKYIGLKMPADVTVSQTYTLPVLDGSAGQVLSTDGSGVMSWTDKDGGGGLSPLTVQAKNGANGAPLGITSNVSTISFNTGNGFSVTDLGSGEAFIELGSSFAPWYVDGQATLAPAGEEPIKFIAGSGISITTNPNTLIKEIKFEATGGGSGGSGGSGAGIHLQEVQTSTGGQATFSQLGMSGILQSVSSTVDAWIVLYSSSAQRDADAGRAFSEDPLPGSGVLFEAYVAAGGVVTATPGTTYLNSETPTIEAIYATVRGQDGSNIAADVTINAFGLAAISAVNGGTFGSGV